MGSPLGTWFSSRDIAHIRRLHFLTGMASGLAIAVVAFKLGGAL